MGEKPKPSWTLTTGARKTLRVAAFMTILGLGLSLLATFLGVIVFPDVERVPAGMLPVALFICLVAACLVAAFYLCLGMVFFMFTADRRPVVWKCLLFLAFLVGSSVTASLYYLVVYRPFLKRQDLTCG